VPFQILEQALFWQEFSNPERVFELILEDVRAWKAAGCVTGF
jgi:hypothetical protein